MSSREAFAAPQRVLDAVAATTGARITAVAPLTGGTNGGALRLEVDGRDPLVLKATPRLHAGQLDDAVRAQRLVRRLRQHGYPTPDWLAVGATHGHVWHLTELVEATPADRLTPSIVDQLLPIVDLQTDLACDPYDHWSYAWRVASGHDAEATGSLRSETAEQSRLSRAIARLPQHSEPVAALVERLHRVCGPLPPPRGAPDVVHADLATPSNILLRDGVVTAVVDIGNAGSGTRAIDLVSLAWAAGQDPRLDDTRRGLWERAAHIVGGDAALVLASSHVLHMLEVAVRRSGVEDLADVVERGHRVVDEVRALH